MLAYYLVKNNNNPKHYLNKAMTVRTLTWEYRYKSNKDLVQGDSLCYPANFSFWRNVPLAFTVLKNRAELLVCMDAR